MKLRKSVIIALICVAFLVILQLLSYLGFSSVRIPSIALHLTPERTHFDKGASFSWVWLKTADCQNLTDDQKGILTRLLRRRYRHVYLSENELPKDAQILDPAGRWIGYKDGFSFAFSVVSHGPFWVRVAHLDHEGNLAASSAEHVYVWILGIWLKVHDGPMTVA